MDIRQIVDLERFPLDALDSIDGAALLARCRAALDRDGMFNLEGFMRPAALDMAMGEISPVMARDAFTHARRHNIYFRDVPELAAGHPALRLFETVNHTVCWDQIPNSLIARVYAWPPLADFLARVIGKPMLHTMADPLARVNVMSYGEGEALNWHFDRSEFTTTLLLQAPEAGGAFEYRTDLRCDDDPNYDGVARLLAGADPEVRTLALSAGTLNVFKGRNTAHRVTTVKGARKRFIAVFSYYEKPDVMFSPEERIGFYGRAA